jgi:hypothetical protein
MTITIKKTKNLSNEEKTAICILFKRVFTKEMTLDDFEHKFLSNTFKTSYHGLLLNDANEIVGCYSSIPQEYNYFGIPVVFGLSVDTMIDEEYRGNPFTLKNLANEVYSAMQQDRISFVFGFPNDNVYLVRKKVLKWTDIGKLDFYIMPINIGAIKPSLAFLNIVSSIYSRIINLFVNSHANKSCPIYGIEKNNNKEYKDSRYDKSYQVVNLGDNGYFSYKIYTEKAIKTAYILDVYPLCKSNLQQAVKMVYKSNKNDIDLIIYVGKLHFNVVNLIKIPEKYQPKNVYMSGKILDGSIVDQRVYDLGNWNVNLSNYDVR